MFSEIARFLGGNIFDGLDRLIRDFKLPPEKLVEYEQFKEKVKVELAQISQVDRASARLREQAMAGVGMRDKVPPRLAYLTFAGFFTVLAAQGYMAFQGIHIVPEIQRTLDISLGVLFAMVLAVKDYYFGSSSGGDQIIQLVAKNGNGKTGG